MPDLWVKHIRQEGARFHVISWSLTRNGVKRHCSEPRCEINR